MNNLNKILIYILLISLLLVGCSPRNQSPPEDNNPDPVEEPPVEDPYDPIVDEIQERLDHMTLEEKVGQLLIVGFEGTVLDDITRSYIEDLQVGGLVFFGRNIESRDQVIELVKDIKEIDRVNEIPLFLSIDEEDRNVSRLPKEYKRLPNSLDIGATDDRDLAFQYGELLGNRVKSLGLNLNFAPVLDIHSNPKNPVIGKRAFGNTPERVSEIGLEVARGIRNTSMIPSIKHFPGHGDTSTDSHIELPIIDKSLEELKNFEWIPFRAAIHEDIEMIMIAHILLPSIDEEYPSTLSQNIIGEILRDTMGYEGVVISDDMTMGAIVNNYSLEEASIDYLKAGGDIVLVCHGEQNPKIVFDRIMEGIETGELTTEEIDEKVYRILELKDRYLKDEDMGMDLDLEELNKTAEEIIERTK